MQGLAIEGYAIISADGMIADQSGRMPDGLRCDADARFFTEGLDSAALVVHGRNSGEPEGPVENRRLHRLYLVRGMLRRLPCSKEDPLVPGTGGLGQGIQVRERFPGH